MSYFTFSLIGFFLSIHSALSVWWKAAIQANIKSRMWMQLGSSPTESMLPPRFERLYQPEKIAQFDRFFARAWATPVRRSHSAQHSKGSSDDDTGARDFRRRVSVHNSSGPGKTDTSAQPSTTGHRDENALRVTKTLDNFVNSYGLQPHFKPTLKSFAKHHDVKHRNNGVSSSRLSGKQSLAKCCKQSSIWLESSTHCTVDPFIFTLLYRGLTGIFRTYRSNGRNTSTRV